MPAEWRRWFHGAKTQTPAVMPIRGLGNGGEPPFDYAQDRLPFDSARHDLHSKWAEPSSGRAQPRMSPKLLSFSKGSALEDFAGGLSRRSFQIFFRRSRPSTDNAPAERPPTAMPPAARPPIAIKPTEIPPSATIPIALPPRATMPRALPPRAMYPRAEPPRASQPRASSPIAMMPWALP